MGSPIIKKKPKKVQEDKHVIDNLVVHDDVSAVHNAASTKTSNTWHEKHAINASNSLTWHKLNNWD